MNATHTAVFSGNTRRHAQAKSREGARWPAVLVLMPSLVIACIGALPASALAQPAPDATRPNFLVLVSDDQRPDTIGALNPAIRTPNLDRLARQGLLFTRAITANPICTPSRAEILTGTSGYRNGVLDFGGAIDERLVPWPRAMARAGYRTAYVGKWHNNGRPSTHGYQEALGLFSGGGGRWWTDRTDYRGHDVTGYRGWIFQEDDGTLHPDLGVGLTPDISARFADAAIRFIEQPGSEPFFLHVNFTAPHDPLLLPPGDAHRYRPGDISPPPNFAPEHPFDHGNLRGRDEQLLPWPRTTELVEADLAAYYAVISHLDEQVGRILQAADKAGKLANTVVVYTSDHGLAMGSHGLRGKQSMYDHTIGVPLIFCGPKIPGGRTTAAQVYLRDLYPTVCELAGVDIPDTVEATSFASVVHGERDAAHGEVYAYFRDKQRMVRNDRWKLIEYPEAGRIQLFDLRADPAELDDRSRDPQYAATLAELKKKLDDGFRRRRP